MSSFLSRILMMAMFLSISIGPLASAATAPRPTAAQAPTAARASAAQAPYAQSAGDITPTLLSSDIGAASMDVANIPQIYIRLILVDRNYKPLEAQSSYKPGDLELWRNWQLIGYFNDKRIDVFRFDDYDPKKISEKYQFKDNKYCMDGGSEPNKNHKILQISIDMIYIEGKHEAYYSLFKRNFEDLGNSCDINGNISGAFGLPDRESTAKLVYTGEKLNGIAVYDLLLPPMWGKGSFEADSGYGWKLIFNEDERATVIDYFKKHYY